MDSVDPDIIERSRSAALTIDGVHDVTTKARWSGRRLTIEAIVTLDPDTHLDDASHTCRHVELAIHSQLSEARVVHAVPVSA